MNKISRYDQIYQAYLLLLWSTRYCSNVEHFGTLGGYTSLRNLRTDWWHDIKPDLDVN